MKKRERWMIFIGMILAAFSVILLLTLMRNMELKREMQSMQRKAAKIIFKEKILTENDKKKIAAESMLDSRLVYQKAYPNLYAVPATTIKREDKVVYLTFDDGPSKNTIRVLDELKAHQVKATFFVTGIQIDQHPELVQRIVQEGHAIGIHTNTHNYQEVYRSVDSYLNDSEQCLIKIKKLTNYPVSVVRMPGGSINAYNQMIFHQISSEMLRRGFVYFDWNVSSGDASGREISSDMIVNNVMHEALSENKAVILMHDGAGKEATANAVGTIIEKIKTNGYQFDVLSNQTEPVFFGYYD